MDKDKKMTLYLAGPMRGYKDHNFPAFHRKAKELRDKGFRVISPAEMDETIDGINSDGSLKVQYGKDGRLDIRHYALRDVNVIIKECDGIYLLKGWTQSKGANAEAMLARWCNMKFYFEDPMETALLDVDFFGLGL